jgi:lipoyl(octanoyl) transferase
LVLIFNLKYYGLIVYLHLQSKPFTTDMQQVLFKDLGLIDYKNAWDYQENLLQQNVRIKTAARHAAGNTATTTIIDKELATANHLLFCEHTPVYTLGKSGSMDNVLINAVAMKQQNIQFFNTNRGGDITFHGPGQLVGYPVLDLENFYTDIGRYLRSIEEVIILSIAEYGIKGERSSGETGVWIEPGVKGKERKICAIGVRCSRWITMHGFALNVNTDLNYFNNIIPCGIQNKQVTSIQREVGAAIDFNNLKETVRKNFAMVFDAEIMM